MLSLRHVHRGIGCAPFSCLPRLLYPVTSQVQSVPSRRSHTDTAPEIEEGFQTFRELSRLPSPLHIFPMILPHVPQLVHESLQPLQLQAPRLHRKAFPLLRGGSARTRSLSSSDCKEMSISRSARIQGLSVATSLTVGCLFAKVS